MLPTIVLLIELALLLIGYWVADLLVHRDGLVRGLRRLGIGSADPGKLIWPVSVWTVPLVLIAPVWNWTDTPDASAVRIVGVVIAAALTWKATTRDIDPVTGITHGWLRVLLLIFVGIAWFSPAALLIAMFLLTTPFGMWEHHATLPMRVLQAVSIFPVCVAIVGLLPADLLPWEPFATAAPVFLFAVTIPISHYLITAFAKMWLGPKWYSWPWDNRLHHLAASAYSWGWAKFLPWSVWRRVIGIVRVMERPMQFAAFGVELLSPFAMLHPRVGVGFLLAWSLFHLGVFLVSGLLFWDWMVANVAIAIGILSLPASTAGIAFGVGPLIISIAVMAIFPLRHRLWKPMPLGWWDTPLTQRMHWEAHGESGEIYGVYNNFMCPHERLYGKVHACFLAPLAGMTYHLGEVWKHDLRDAIRDAGSDAERLETVRQQFGISPRDDAMTLNHLRYLRQFFRAVNAGARKQILPRPLRWLKAPGGQIFYWGDRPAYRGTEPIEFITLHYREEYFDGERLHRITDLPVLCVRIEADCEPECIVEPTPKQIDDLLLSHANGKLIDLPNFGDGYVGGDDGKVAV